MAPTSWRIMGASITSDGFTWWLAPTRTRRACDYAGDSAGGPRPRHRLNARRRRSATWPAEAINNAGGNRPAVYAPKSALGHSVGAVRRSRIDLGGARVARSGDPADAQIW